MSTADTIKNAIEDINKIRGLVESADAKLNTALDQLDNKPVEVPITGKYHVSPYVNLNLRTGPSTNYKPEIRTMSANEVLWLTNPERDRPRIGTDNWIHVNNEGWCLGSYTTVAAPGIGHAMKGWHGVADPSPDFWKDAHFAAIHEAGIETMLFLLPGIDVNILRRAVDAGIKFPHYRLFWKAHGSTPAEAAQFFINETKDAAFAIYNETLRMGIPPFFQIHNEANHPAEGLSIWKNGAGYREFHHRVYDYYEQHMPQALLGFCGLSPNPTYVYPMWKFIEEAGDAVTRGPWIGHHAYWQNRAGLAQAIEDTKQFCLRFKRQLVITTEYANTNIHTPKATKGEELNEFVLASRHNSKNYLGSDVFILDASNNSVGSGGFGDQIIMGSKIIEAMAKI